MGGINHNVFKALSRQSQTVSSVYSCLMEQIPLTITQISNMWISPHILFVCVLLSAGILEPGCCGSDESVRILIRLTNKWFAWQEKYPDVVSLPEGCRSELMIIRSPQLPG